MDTWSGKEFCTKKVQFKRLKMELNLSHEYMWHANIIHAIYVDCDKYYGSRKQVEIIS